MTTTKLSDGPSDHDNNDADNPTLASTVPKTLLRLKTPIHRKERPKSSNNLESYQTRPTGINKYLCSQPLRDEQLKMEQPKRGNEGTETDEEGGKKKRGDDDLIMDLIGPRRVPYDEDLVLIVDNDLIEVDTSACDNLTDITMHLDDNQRKIATTPFTGAIGEDNNFLSKWLENAVLQAAKVLYRKTEFDETEMKILQQRGLSQTEWLEVIPTFLGSKRDAALGFIPDAHVDDMKVFLLKLAHTPATTLFGQVKKKRVVSSMASRAWYGAKTSLGSWYNHKKGKKQKDLRKLLKQMVADQTKTKLAAQSTQGKEVTSNDEDTPMIDLSNESDSSPAKEVTPNKPPKEKQTKLAVTTKNKLNSAQIKDKRSNAARVQYRFKIRKIKDSEDVTANEVLLELAQSLFKAYKRVDKSIVILPWLKIHMEKAPITTTDEYPTKISEFKIFTNKLRPKQDSNCWFVMHLAFNGEVNDIYSGDASSTSDWFDDHECAAYPCTVQNSDNPVSLGDFLYSGDFMDPVRLQDEIEKVCEKRYRKRFNFGCRGRVTKELQNTSNNWLLATNRLIHIEVDKKQARGFKAVLYQEFNKKTDPYDRPGGYNIRLLPDQTQLIRGTSGNKLRINTLRKHEAVVKSLDLIKSDDVKELDKGYNKNGNRYTLRSILQETTFPLVPKQGQTPKPLFFSIDCAPNGDDAKQGVTCFTAYANRSTLANQLVQILPTYIKFILGDEQAVKEWFHPFVLGSINEVIFECDDDGEWNGQWQTPDDTLQYDILQEDMGVTLEIDYADFNPGEEQVFTTDDMSEKTFGTQFGQKQPVTINTTDNDDDEDEDDAGNVDKEGENDDEESEKDAPNRQQGSEPAAGIAAAAESSGGASD